MADLSVAVGTSSYARVIEEKESIVIGATLLTGVEAIETA